MFSEVAEIALVASLLGQLQQPIKCVILPILIVKIFFRKRWDKYCAVNKWNHESFFYLYRWLFILVVNGPESEIRSGFSTAGKCTRGATWQILIRVKHYGGHSLGTRLSFSIECIQAWSAGPRINDNQACDSLNLSFEQT